MESLLILVVAIMLSSVSNVFGEEISANYMINQLNRSSFPQGFIFGTGTSSCQIEGAWNEDGKGPSIWDHYVHLYPDKIKDKSNADKAVDSYHLYKQDVKLAKEMNSDGYRFSISWSRILPSGKLSGGVNEKGIKYYNRLINNLISNSIQPFVTIFHWDVPQNLEEYGGFLNPQIINDFVDFANICFERFGDRVKFWTTFNEPLTFSVVGYSSGGFAPFRCSDRSNCAEGNSTTEPYIVSHHILLAHAEAVKLYRTKYQATQKGKIGIVLNSGYSVPLTNTSEDRSASRRQLDFQFGWFMNPLTNGDYPSSMRRLVGNRLPKFTKEQSESLKGSIDYLGLNYYSSEYAANNPSPSPVANYSTDPQTKLSHDKNGVLIGPATASDWLYIYPRGIYDLLRYVKRKYNDPVIYITENGISEVNNSTLSLKVALQDGLRVKYYYDHLAFVHKAIKEGVNVKGFFAWALLDNFEWNVGYTVRFGLNYVDYKNKFKRYPKLSAKWFKNFLKQKPVSEI